MVTKSPFKQNLKVKTKSNIILVLLGGSFLVALQVLGLLRVHQHFLMI